MSKIILLAVAAASAFSTPLLTTPSQAGSFAVQAAQGCGAGMYFSHRRDGSRCAPVSDLDTVSRDVQQYGFCGPGFRTVGHTCRPIPSDPPSFSVFRP